MKPFRPKFGSTKAIAATVTSGRVDLASTQSGEYQVRIFNAGAQVAFVRPGSATVDAAITDLPVPAGAIEVLTVRNLGESPETHMAAITSTGSANVYFTLGEGI